MSDTPKKLWEALAELDARPAELPDFKPEEMPVPFTLDGLAEGGGNWVLHTRLVRIDVVQWVPGSDRHHGAADGARARGVAAQYHRSA